jgi:hypothetical protein
MEFLDTYFFCSIKLLLEKIDIILMASITLIGFMIASVSILQNVIPSHFKERGSLIKDIYNEFFISIRILIYTSVISLIAFLFRHIDIMEWLGLVSFLLLLLGLYYIYRSVNILNELIK